MSKEVKRGRPVVKGSKRQIKMKLRAKQLAELGLTVDSKLPKGRKPTKEVEKRRSWVAKQFEKEVTDQPKLVEKYVEKFGAHKEQFYMDKRHLGIGA